MTPASLLSAGLLAFALALLAMTLKRVLKRVLLRRLLRAGLTEAGRRALESQPQAVRLERLEAPAWRDLAPVEAMARPLLALGFTDCGVYSVDKLPGVKIWFLLKEETGVAAFVHEHPTAVSWVEFSVRYEDGSTTALSTMPPTGIHSPPFHRRLQAEAGEPTDRLYARLLRERETQGVKKVTPQSVVPEYEAAFSRMMAWQKAKGLSLQELAAVAKKRLGRRQDGR